MGSTEGRRLPSRRVRHLLLAIQEVMGRSGLTTTLKQAGLQRYTVDLPSDTLEPGLSSLEYAALMQAIENYYGRGARGTLIRLGHASFQQLVLGQRRRARLRQMLYRLLPTGLRQGLALQWLASVLAPPRGRVAVVRQGPQLHFEDHESDGTFGRPRDSAICWVTLGQIQAALKWGTGQDYLVTEIACRAKGDPACLFEVGEPLS